MSETLLSKTPINAGQKIHPWRRCPIGKHLVREHPLYIPPSKTHPSGFVTTRHEHCADNPSHKVEDYKGVLDKRLSGKKYNPKLMERFHDYYKPLQEAQNKPLG
jgi:hypothetical protein